MWRYGSGIENAFPPPHHSSKPQNWHTPSEQTPVLLRHTCPCKHNKGYSEDLKSQFVLTQQSLQNLLFPLAHSLRDAQSQLCSGAYLLFNFLFSPHVKQESTGSNSEAQMGSNLQPPGVWADAQPFSHRDQTGYNERTSDLTELNYHTKMRKDAP